MNKAKDELEASCSTVWGRRRLVFGLVAAGAVVGTPAWAAAQQPGRMGSPGAKKAEEEEEVAPPEDLMREHGVLNRILLIYDEAVRRLDAKGALPPDPLRSAASIIRTFIEDYHEKLEEDYLFPRFEKAGRLADLTTVLRAQHQAGRRLTDQVTQLATLQSLKDPARVDSLKNVLRQFNRMYRPHEAREDTVLFPALRQIVSKHEFGALGEDFEKKEHQLFGEDGFEKIVDRVASIERALGINDLAQFTPKV
jgi:hemerythrin-like domain-containing protein